jgi:hypothetical protein
MLNESTFAALMDSNRDQMFMLRERDIHLVITLDKEVLAGRHIVHAPLQAVPAAADGSLYYARIPGWHWYMIVGPDHPKASVDFWVAMDLENELEPAIRLPY